MQGRACRAGHAGRVMQGEPGEAINKLLGTQDHSTLEVVAQTPSDTQPRAGRSTNPMASLD